MQYSFNLDEQFDFDNWCLFLLVNAMFIFCIILLYTCQFPLKFEISSHKVILPHNIPPQKKYQLKALVVYDP